MIAPLENTCKPTLDSEDEGSKAQAPESGDDPELSAGASLKAAGRCLSELKEYASVYLASKSDLWKLSARRLVWTVCLGVVGLIVGGSMLAAASVLLLIGVSSAIGSLFPGAAPWAGQVLVGLVFVGGSIVCTWWVFHRFTNASRARMVAKYERRHNDQRRCFGHDVVDRSAQG